MKQITQSYRTGKVELKTVPAPLCRETGVLVKTYVSLVSAGTEKAMVNLAKRSLAGKAKERPDLVKKVMEKIREEGILPTIGKVFHKLQDDVPLGYSCAGKVIAVGDTVEEFRKGDRVACGGAGYASHAEINFVPKNLCVKVPDSVSLEEASFTTVGAIALEAIRRCQLAPGEKVGVIGLGLLGKLTSQILLAYGYPVMGIEINEKTAQKARQLGLDKIALIGKDDIKEAVSELTSGHGLDAVIITASSKTNEPVALAGRICRLAGRVVVVGAVGMDVPRDIYYEKGLDLRISRSYGPGRYDVNYEEKGIDYPYAYVRWTEKRNMEEFLRLVSLGRIKLKAMVSHRFKLEDYMRVYDLILKDSSGEEYSGIVFEYSRQEGSEPTLVLNEKRAKQFFAQPVCAGLIGCGNFAQSVMLPNLKNFKNVRIKAVASATGKTAERTANQYGCEYATTDYGEIIKDKEINTVFIATRHNLHAAMVIEALKGRKHVFVEKPLCLNENQLKEIIETYKALGENPPLLMVGFNRRFAPLVIEAKNKLASRSTPLMIQYRINAGYIPPEHWVHDAAQGGGRGIGEVCHFIDLLQFLTDAAPVKIYATGLPATGKVLADDNISLVIDFSDGSRGNILYTALGDKMLGKEHIEIFGSGKSLVVNDFKSGQFSIGQDKGHSREFKVFLDAISRGQPAPISFKEIILSTLTTLKIYQSIKTGEPIKIDINQIA